MKTMNLFVAVIFAVVFIALFANVLVVAEEDDSINQTTVNQEIATADQELNESVSSWDITKEKMKNWFTFNKDKKTEREFKIAKMLLVQARIEAKNNDTEAMESAFEAHNRILERIELRMRERSSEGNSSEEADKLVGIDRAIQVHHIRIERLKLLLQNENLTAEEIAIINDKIAKAQNVTQNLEDVKNDKIDKLKMRLMVKANLTEEQANAVISELEDSHEIKELKEAIKDAREKNREDMKEIREDSKELRKKAMEKAKEEAKQARENRGKGSNSDDSADDGSDDNESEDDSEED